MNEELTNDQLISIIASINIFDECSERARKILLERMKPALPPVLTKQDITQERFQSLVRAIVHVVPMQCCTVEMALDWVARNLPDLLGR